ncbi:hypothetical protein QR680_014821 [Steinernema hermaphroditum]|uniref:DNA2/NAM7 helicase helicase domain-containing protein n=1 Tax=Steinernema hermaphroditum TaxID=289476 RepID=A0AA39M4J6_9BILA|nr:hypothetical protein QR680_014821 [Steinernema hermaphroditum]
MKPDRRSGSEVGRTLSNCVPHADGPLITPVRIWEPNGDQAKDQNLWKTWVHSHENGLEAFYRGGSAPAAFCYSYIKVVLQALSHCRYGTFAKRVLGWARRVLHANLTYQPVLDALEHEKDAFEKQFDDLKELPLALRRATDQDLRDEDVDLRARPFLYVVDKSRTEARLIDRCLDIGDDVAAELWDSTGSRIVSQKTICIRETFFGTYVYFMNKNGNVCDIVPGHNEALGNSVAEFTCTIHPKRFLQREILRCWRRLSHNFETLVAPGSRLSSPNRPPLRFRGPPGPTDQEQYPAVEFVNLTEFQERTIAWLCSVFNLNEEQTKAVRMCYGTSLCSVHGPPGTGKTTTAAVLLIVFLVVDTLTKGCVDEVIVASATNTAVDNFLRAFHKRVTQLEEHRLLAIDQDFCGVDGFNSTLFRTAIKNVVKAAKGVFPSKKAPEAMIYRRYGRYAIRDENLTDMYSRSKVQRGRGIPDSGFIDISRIGISLPESAE